MTSKSGWFGSVALAVLAGSLISAQARVNSGLGIEIGSGIFAALISFSSGLVIISLAVFLSRSNRQRLSSAIADLKNLKVPIWLALAGFIGGVFVMVQSVVAGIIGIALFSIGVVAGSSLAALVLDGNGLLGLTKRPIGLVRVIGTVIAFSGLLVASDLANYEFNPVILLPFLAGIGIGFQQAMNGLFGKLIQSPVVGTFFNFLSGTILIAVSFLMLEGTSIPTEFPSNPLLYLGGLVGVIFIFTQIVIIPKIGALMLSISMLTGQLAGSLLLDLFTPVADRGVTIWSLAGVLLALLGALLVAYRGYKTAQK